MLSRCIFVKNYDVHFLPILGILSDSDSKNECKGSHNRALYDYSSSLPHRQSAFPSGYCCCVPEGGIRLLFLLSHIIMCVIFFSYLLENQSYSSCRNTTDPADTLVLKVVFRQILGKMSSLKTDYWRSNPLHQGYVEGRHFSSHLHVGELKLQSIIHFSQFTRIVIKLSM